MALWMKQKPSGEHSLERVDRATLKKVWPLNAPPKVLNFVCGGPGQTSCPREIIYSTRRGRLIRGVNCAVTCQQPETACHILWDFPFARNVWALVQGRIRKCSNAWQEIFLLFSFLERLIIFLKL